MEIGWWDRAGQSGGEGAFLLCNLLPLSPPGASGAGGPRVTGTGAQQSAGRPPEWLASLTPYTNAKANCCTEAEDSFPSGVGDVS